MRHAVNYPRSARRFDGTWLFAAALLIACQGAALAGEYTVSVDARLATLTVNACFDMPVPEALHPGSSTARRYVKAAQVDGRELRSQDHEILPLGENGRSCVEYLVDARSAAARRFPNARLIGSLAVLLDPSDWLWLPEPGTAPEQFLRFELPEEMDVSVPWPAAGPGRFRIDGAMREWPALIAVGRMSTERIVLPGGELRYAALPGSPPADEAMVRDWMLRGARAITMIYGSFPVPSPQVLVIPIGRGGEAVPWGQVQRGGGAAAHLFIDQTRSTEEFAADWVLVHELSHFVHPNLGSDSAWLSEGLATYYQYVARARAGMLTEQESWQKLHEGFERGRQQTRRGVDLVEATRNMREQRIFMRVYWTGTALALLADLALRDAGSSLDAVLEAFKDCCLAEPRVWEAGEFLQRLDRLAGNEILSELSGRYLGSDRFPDLTQAYTRLGLRESHGRIQLDADPAASALRRAIMAPRH
jgi:hypothetical protein